MAGKLTAGRLAVGSGADERVIEERLGVAPGFDLVEARAQSFRVSGDAAEWPSELVHLDSYPNDVGADWMLGGDAWSWIWGGKVPVLQGVGHDADHWFITTTTFMLRLPVEFDLTSDIGDVFIRPWGGEAWFQPPLPSDWLSEHDVWELSNLGILSWIPRELRDIDIDHFGDLECHGGIIYVAMSNVERKQSHVVAAFRASDLAFLGSADLVGQDGAAWAAVNPVTGLLYCGTRVAETGLRAIQVYRPKGLTDRRLDLDPLGHVRVADENGAEFQAPGFQGGAFSNAGHLYITVEDVEDADAFRGVLGMEVDALTARIGLRLAVEPTFDVLRSEAEIEGLTVWNLAGSGRAVGSIGRAPGIGGQIHVLDVNHDLNSSDNLVFHHWGAAVSERGLV